MESKSSGTFIIDLTVAHAVLRKQPAVFSKDASQNIGLMKELNLDVHRETPRQTVPSRRTGKVMFLDHRHQGTGLFWAYVATIQADVALDRLLDVKVVKQVMAESQAMAWNQVPALHESFADFFPMAKWHFGMVFAHLSNNFPEEMP